MESFLVPVLIVIAFQYVWFSLGMVTATVTQMLYRSKILFSRQPDPSRIEPFIISMIVAVGLAIGINGMDAFWPFGLGACVAVFLGNHFMNVGRYYT